MLRSHIRLPSDGVGLDGRPKAIICIIKGKTRHRAARVQSVVVHDAETVRLLEVVLHGVAHTTALLPGGTAGLRLRFAELLSALRVSHIAYSPASLRPGGALHVFAAGNVSLADLMYRGRWDCAKTLSHYLQEGFAALASVLVPPTAAVTIRGLSDLLPELVEELAEQKGLRSTQQQHGPAALSRLEYF